jgi:hypothetical protein
MTTNKKNSWEQYRKEGKISENTCRIGKYHMKRKH